MPRVQRPPIQADIGAETVQLNEPLHAVVAALAQALERTEPELVDVAVMRLNVITDFRRRDDAALETERIKRMFAQLVLPGSSPSELWSTTCPILLVRRERPLAQSTVYVGRTGERYGARGQRDVSRLISARKAKYGGDVMASGLQVLFGKFAKLIGNGPRRSQHN
jgi:hypothetical protein